MILVLIMIEMSLNDGYDEGEKNLPERDKMIIIDNGILLTVIVPVIVTMMTTTMMMSELTHGWRPPRGGERA